MRGFCVLLVLGCVLGVHSWAAPPLAKERDKPETPPTKAEADASLMNLKIIALGWHNYESAYNTFPNNLRSKGKDKKVLLSWRVALLPYMEEEELFQQFKLDEPWDSEHNKKLIEKIPKIYKPVRGKAAAGETFYQAFAGANASLPEDPISIVTFTDGTSNTLVVAEAEKAVIWTKPDDIPFDGKLDGDARPAVGGMFKGHFHVAFGDGSVRFFSNKINTKTLRYLVTRNGGEVVDHNDLPVSDLFKD